MLFAILLALSAISGGTLLTYLYDRRAPLLWRACAGACTGLAALALVGFVNASLIGLTPIALALAGLVVASPLLLLRRAALRERVRADVRETSRALRRALTFVEGGGTLLFYASAAILCWWVFAQAMYETPEGIFTGLDNNIGDLPFHTGIITGFVYGENYPPEHPEFAGVRLTYPFLADFLTAIFMRAGASLEGSMFWQNFVLALSFVGLLHRWALELTRDRVAAILAPVIILFNGGLGFVRFFGEAFESGRGVFDLLGQLSRYYTMAGDTLKWGNVVVVMLAPQRGLLLGFPLAIIVWTLWWQRTDGETGRRGDGETEERGRGEGEKRQNKGKKKTGKKQRAQVEDGIRLSKGEGATNISARPTSSVTSSPHHPVTPSPRLHVSVSPQMIAAGIVAGLLPLIHAHSFVVLMSMGACLAVLFCLRWPWMKEEDGRGFLLSRWREWAAFFVAALVVAVPQMFWATYKSDVQAASFFGWQFGWDRGTQSVVMFWLKNTGLFIPLLVAAILWRGRDAVVPKRLLIFSLPFALCFVVPNLFKLSPWIWDNIKILFYWWIAAAPLVALLLARLWRMGIAARASAVALLVVLTLAGALDVWRVASGAMRQPVFTREGVTFAELVRREAAPRSLILHAPTYNHPVYLTGRRSLMGYAGHLGSHGLDFAQRERDVARIYLGTADADALLKKYGVTHVVVGPHELRGDEMQRIRATVNEAFFQNYTKVGEVGGYSLYKTSR